MEELTFFDAYIGVLKVFGLIIAAGLTISAIFGICLVIFSQLKLWYDSNFK